MGHLKGSEGEGTGCGGKGGVGKGYWEAGLSPGRVLAGSGQNL